VLAEIVNRQDVGMIERRDGLRLLLESAQSLRIARERCGQNFDGDIPVETGVARAIHLAHAAGSGRSDDLVWANACARG
jgi:hypothetical protein